MEEYMDNNKMKNIKVIYIVFDILLSSSVFIIAVGISKFSRDYLNICGYYFYYIIGKDVIFFMIFIIEIYQKIINKIRMNGNFVNLFLLNIAINIIMIPILIMWELGAS
jgi:hypothetical protein